MRVRLLKNYAHPTNGAHLAGAILETPAVSEEHLQQLVDARAGVVVSEHAKPVNLANATDDVFRNVLAKADAAEKAAKQHAARFYA